MLLTNLRRNDLLRKWGFLHFWESLNQLDGFLRDGPLVQLQVNGLGTQIVG